MIGVAPHVLRYWETQFPQLRPMKRPDGRRYYRPDDVTLAAGILQLLRNDGLTIRGARKRIAEDRGQAVRARGVRLIAEIAPEEAVMPQMSSPPLSPDPATDAQADHAAPALPLETEPELLPATPSEPAQPPLLSDIPSDADQAVWLVRLTSLARRLQRIHASDPSWAAARNAAVRLGHTMIRIY